MPRRGQRKCHHCGQLYEADRRNRYHQKYCTAPACRQASKAASQHRWLRSPNGRDYFKGAANGFRVAQWRLKHPGYWRRHTRKPLQAPVALQDFSILQVKSQPEDSRILEFSALQELLFAQQDALQGLIFKLAGHSLPGPGMALQDFMAFEMGQLILLGRQVQGRGSAHAGPQTTPLSPPPPPRPPAVQLDRPAPGTG